MKKTLALLLALVMLLPAGTLWAGAEGPSGYTFSPTVSPGLTQGETTVETGIPGMTLTLGADEWSQSDVDIPIVSATGVSYSGFLTGKANPRTAEGTGTYYTFSFDQTVGTGSLEIMYRLNSGKAFFIMDNGQAMKGFDGMKLDVSADTSTTIIVEGGHTYTVYASGSKLRLYGCTFQNVDPLEVFAAEIAAFPFSRIGGVNADAAHVDEDLALVDSYESQFGSCDVSWTSSDPSVVDLDGTVNCQKEESAVVLTGHFSVQEDRRLAAQVTLALTVLADPDDASAVAVAREALTLGDLSAVRRNLDLPAKGKRGTAITWSSSDETVVEPDGKVHPAANEDKSAVLTATVKRGEISQSRDFPVTVAGIVPVTLDSWSYADGAGNIRFTPVDGGRLKSVNLTCNDPNPGPDDVVVLVAYGPDGAEKSRQTYPARTVFAGVPTGKSVCLEVEDMGLDAADRLELWAMNNSTGEGYITPAVADDTLVPFATVYVVGDSTASVYGDDRYPRKGWAQMLGGYVQQTTVNDLALSGRSSGSFKGEANYTTLKNALKKGDWLIIQFGHNDNKADSYADPAGDRFTDGSFKKSMLEYVELAWEKGARPIIATSISRRKVSDASLEAYVTAARELAQELSVPCVDLYAATNGWIGQVGEEGAQDMFNCLKPYDSRFMDYPAFTGSEFYEKGSSDDTHLNIYGASLIAQWFADAVRDQALPLAACLNGKTAAPLRSYAQAVETPPLFSDVQGTQWFYPSVKAACDKGLMEGTGEGAFTPDGLTSRVTVAALLWRLAGSPVFTPPEGAEVPSRDYYPDVAPDQWYTEAVRWCTEQGVVTGGDDGLFAPDAPVTREQLVTMLWRWGEKQGLDLTAGQPGVYADGAAVSPWARSAMDWACGAGVISGKPGGLLDPQGQLTRAEAAAVLERFAALAQG